MTLIADSGSTKVDWRVIHKDGTVQKIQSAGINPYFQTKEQIIYELQQNLCPNVTITLENICFYGAGVVGDKVEMLKECFNSIFLNAVVEAHSDLLAAARSLCGHKPGIAAILGTGGNSCFYDGEKIADNVPAGGFILGDEGSGAVLGKKLISDFLKRQLPADIKKKFDEKFGLDYPQIVEKVYKQAFPSRYLATFSMFINENRKNTYIEKLLSSTFEEFFIRNIMNYDYKKYSVNIVGSVAHCYEDVLRAIAANKGINIGKILKNPVDGLVEYHKGLI